MKILFYLGHPAHFHLFKNSITDLLKGGHKVEVLIKKKDVLEDLLIRSSIPYHNIMPEGRKDGKIGIAWGLLKRNLRLLFFCLKSKPDIMLGTSVEICHIGFLLHIPAIDVNEDDADVVPLHSKLGYPFAKYILSPDVCNNGKWMHKSIQYPGYHELAYLHPQNFIPDMQLKKKYIPNDNPYFIIRFVKLNAHHDKGIKGISDTIGQKIIEILKPHGDVYITSERPLKPEFEPYRLKIDPLDIHHVIAFANLYVGDSQTMAAEAGVLGIPFIRFNDFVGRIGYLNDLEIKYKLGYGIKPANEYMLYEKIKELVTTTNLKEKWQVKRHEMLNDKIDVAAFITWLVTNYQNSVKKLNNHTTFFNQFSKKL